MKRDPLLNAVIAAACLVGAAMVLLSVAIHHASQVCGA